MLLMKHLQTSTAMMKGIYGYVLWHILRIPLKVETEVWSPSLHDTTHSQFSTKVFLFNSHNLNLDKSDEENKTSVFKAWADSKTSYMVSLWQILILNSYLFNHCCNWMGILTLEILFCYFISLLAWEWTCFNLNVSTNVNICFVEYLQNRYLQQKRMYGSSHLSSTFQYSWPAKRTKNVCPVGRQKQQS